MTHDDVQKLGELSRLGIREEDIQAYLKDFDGILGYIDMIRSVDLPHSEKREVIVNVVREDTDPFERGAYSGVLVEQAPSSEDGFIRVQKILS